MCIFTEVISNFNLDTCQYFSCSGNPNNAVKPRGVSTTFQSVEKRALFLLMMADLKMHLVC